MTGFRLVEAGVSGGGPLTVVTVYATTDEARAVAERVLDQLAGRPHRRPWAYRIVDIETGELVDTVWPPSVYNPDPFDLPAVEPPAAPSLPGVAISGDTSGPGEGGKPRGGMQPRVPSQDAAPRPGGRREQ